MDYRKKKDYVVKYKNIDSLVQQTSLSSMGQVKWLSVVSCDEKI